MVIRKKSNEKKTGAMKFARITGWCMMLVMEGIVHSAGKMQQTNYNSKS